MDRNRAFQQSKVQKISFVRYFDPEVDPKTSSANQHKEFMKTPFEYRIPSKATSDLNDLMGFEISYRFSLVTLAHLNANIYHSRAMPSEERFLRGASHFGIAAFAATGSDSSLSEGQVKYFLQPSDSSADSSLNYRLNHATMRLKKLPLS